MIIITGAAGFIGSCMVGKLNDQGHMNLLVVDDFSREDKNRNLLNKKYIARVHRDDLFSWIDRMHHSIEFIFHLGARTDTTEKDTAIFDRLNLHYSQEVWKRCAQYGIPLVYASSAATYGLGELGYDDRHDVVDRLRPLNPYGVSKNDFDIWALEQEKTPPFWAGLKFFNVYGPNEYHKGRMASVIFHTVRQIKATGGMKLFRSHRPDYADGAQSRDFIFVRDVLDIQYFLYQNRAHSGLYNVGTGKARTFLDLATNTFLAMGLAPNISFIDTPEDIRDTYQYFTEANMDKLRGIGYDQPFHSLEDGIREYVQQYLLEEKIF
ncbi:MAG: ADP-L-glycero-D-manno-heptose-6-epimerase [Haliscomenobacter sp.]|jgi:ADP-L-glycero-D-manno-heptose 6-epimerase|nr:ADP-L-glycero-D-manno-heptose-6-epimerase [Haliscomenobacter sp.]